MSVVKYLKTSGWAAIAAATVLTAIPADAAPRGERGHSASQSQSSRSSQRDSSPRQSQPRAERSAPQRPAQVSQREQRPQAAPQRGDQRSQPAPQRGERPAQVAQRGGERPQATPRQGNRPDVRASRPGNWQSSRPVRQQDGQTAQQVRDRGQRGEDVRQPRNTTYADRTRDRTYGGNRTSTNRGDNDARWQDNRHGGDRDRDDRWRGNRDRNGRWQGDGSYRRWDNHWRNDHRYDWNRYRNYNRNIFHIGVYYAPYSYYSYRPLGIGYRLDSLFFGSSYWINDPWQYRLPAAYGPYRWIRYYDDVLLVDIYTGEVIDVIHNFFW
jgi:hypothetical protein